MRFRKYGRRAESSEGAGDDTPRGGTARTPRVKRALGDVGEVATGKISALHERRAGSSRFVVEIDGRVSVLVSAEVIGDLSLRVGRPVDAPLAEQLREAAGRLEVFDKAIALLAVRARSTRDLEMRLKRAGATPPAIAAAIERLQRLGLLDDEAYARNLARSRAQAGSMSKRRIGQELQRRGVARDVADEALAETVADVGLDEMESAMTIAQRRMRSLASLDRTKQRQRLYAFLARRGYESSVISKVVATVIARGGAGDDDPAGALDDGEDENEDD